MTKKAISLVISFVAFLNLFVSCSNNEAKNYQNRIVIWTCNSEFVPYIELFNQTHKEKAVLIYKENPAESLPPAKDEQKPDIIIGPWLRNSKTTRYFKNINFLFDRQFINSKDFYPMLLKSGSFYYKQYLLPVSFNLPAMIFSSENKDLIENNYTISITQIKKAGTDFNQKDEKDNFKRIGFAPQSNDDFLYLVAKLHNSDFKESKNKNFSWNKQNLDESINYLSTWINESNASSKIESDFVYKYLSQTDDKKVLSDRTLFAYTTSDKLFELTPNQLSKIDFRWIQNEGKIPVEDSMIMLGISKWANNISGASVFINWFFQTQTQQILLEHSHKQNLSVTKFGIANGLSSIREVNESILPSYYTTLLTNIPQSGSFSVYNRLPSKWERIKHTIIIPYIKESISSDDTKNVSSMEERYQEWERQRFN